MDSKGEDETMKMSQGSAALQNVYDDASDDSGGYSSDDCEWISMPNGPPPSTLMAESREDSNQSNLDQPLTSKAEFQRARIPPTYYQNDTNSLRQYEDYSVPNGNKAAHPFHSLPSRPLHPPPSPSSTAKTNVPSIQASAVISAEPILRDLKKESTAFVPIAIRKKQAAEKAKAIKEQEKDLLSAFQVEIEKGAESNIKQDDQSD